MMRIGLPVMPLRSHAAICSRRMFRISGIRRFRPFPVLQSIGSAVVFCCRKYSTHCAVCAGSAMSALFIRTIFGLLPMMLFKTGLRLLTGIRASISSATMSTSFKLLWIARRVFAIWPGNHCTDCTSLIALRLPFRHSITPKRSNG